MTTQQNIKEELLDSIEHATDAVLGEALHYVQYLID
jgi:hypothetical protein